MLTLEFIAEHKIAEAVARGEFDNLPGAGYSAPMLVRPQAPMVIRAVPAPAPQGNAVRAQ